MGVIKSVNLEVSSITHQNGLKSDEFDTRGPSNRSADQNRLYLLRNLFTSSSKVNKGFLVRQSICIIHASQIMVERRFVNYSL